MNTALPGYRIGIDLGGSKIEIIVLAPDGHCLLRERISTPRGDYAATLAAIVGLVQHAERTLGRQGSVGIGIPGSESPQNSLIRNANSTWLIGKPLRQDLEHLLQRPLRLANDANCFALSEATDGAAAWADTVFGVILGTGVGGGWVIRGQVLEGCNAIAGEWGHNRLPRAEAWEDTAPSCYCGQRGCIESYLSGPALAQQSGMPPEQLAARAAKGDAASLRILDIYCQRLASALAQVINLVDPEVIVLGGGLSQLDILYTCVPRYWQTTIFSDHVRTRLCRNQHGDSSGVRGAAWLW